MGDEDVSSYGHVRIRGRRARHQLCAYRKVHPVDSSCSKPLQIGFVLSSAATPWGRLAQGGITLKIKKTYKGAAAASVSLALIALGATTAGATSRDRGNTPRPTLDVVAVLHGQDLRHTFGTAGAPVTGPLSGPDDLTYSGHELFVAFQNGVGPQGQPAGNGNTFSTVVGFSPSGRVLGQWDIAGHVDGLSADPGSGRLVATVNEDANSSLYVLDPGSGSMQHYSYDPSPLPHNGGTDAISFYGDRILISASAPGTPSSLNSDPAAAPQVQYPAVYSVSLDPQTLVASVSPLFSDQASAIAANGPERGQVVRLGLTDPDSNGVVPASSPRFAGDFVLDSQGDQQQIYVSDPGGPVQQLAVLSLDQAINDTAWATEAHGVLYASDSSTDTVDAVTGTFNPGTAFVAATPCDANAAPSTCTTANFLGQLDLQTGHVGPVPLSGLPLAPGGLIFIPGGQGPSAGTKR